MIIKHIGQKLDFYECIQLLDKAAEYGIVERIGDSCLKMYCKTMWGEGWNAVPLTACAEVLAEDIDGQTYYREALKQKGVELSEFCELKTLLCAMG